MDHIIKCPWCGEEYLPVEIFLPNEFFGKPEKIIRSDGHIEFITGSDMNLSEKFECYSCGKTLKVQARVNFNVDIDSNQEEYVSTFTKTPKVVLEEGILLDD